MLQRLIDLKYQLNQQSQKFLNFLVQNQLAVVQPLWILQLQKKRKRKINFPSICKNLWTVNNPKSKEWKKNSRIWIFFNKDSLTYKKNIQQLSLKCKSCKIGVKQKFPSPNSWLTNFEVSSRNFSKNPMTPKPLSLE